MAAGDATQNGGASGTGRCPACGTLQQLTPKRRVIQRHLRGTGREACAGTWQPPTTSDSPRRPPAPEVSPPVRERIDRARCKVCGYSIDLRDGRLLSHLVGGRPCRGGGARPRASDITPSLQARDQGAGDQAGQVSHSKASVAVAWSVLLSLVAVVLVSAYFLVHWVVGAFGGDDGPSEVDRRCAQLEAWFKDNPYDSNPTLNREYTLYCGRSGSGG